MEFAVLTRESVVLLHWKYRRNTPNARWNEQRFFLILPALTEVRIQRWELR